MAPPSVAVIGLGYVGLPLALARHFPVAGFDISKSRVAELKDGIDATGEIPVPELAASTLILSDDDKAIGGADYFIRG